jgi:hypothetical protein
MWYNNIKEKEKGKEKYGKINIWTFKSWCWYAV